MGFRNGMGDTCGNQSTSFFGERLGVTPDGTGESLNELVRFLVEPTAKGA